MIGKWVEDTDLAQADAYEPAKQTCPIPATAWRAFVAEYCDICSMYVERMKAIELFEDSCRCGHDFSLMDDNPSGRYLSMGILEPVVICEAWIKENLKRATGDTRLLRGYLLLPARLSNRTYNLPGTDTRFARTLSELGDPRVQVRRLISDQRSRTHTRGWARLH